VSKSWASSYRAIEFLVGQEKLAQNDGLLGDMLLTTQLVTEAIGIVDPTGASDAVNAVVCLAQGDKAGAAMAVASIAVPIGADKLIKHAQKVPTGLVAKAKNHVVDFAESAAQSLRKTADRADDVVAQARHAKKVGEETATSMAARCGNTGNCFVAGTWVLVAHAPAELPRLADTVGATTSGGECTSTTDTVVLAPLLAAGAMGLWLADRPARRRPRRFVRNRKSLRQRLPGREEFQEPGDDHIAPRSPDRRDRPLRRNVSAARRTETALATVAALPGAAVLCESVVPTRSALSRGGKSPVSPGAPSTAGRVAAGPAQAGHSPAMRPLGSEVVTGPSGAAYYARAIETIRTGQRVLARNPELAGGELRDAPVDPATWVNIRLRMPKPTGEFLEITLLRPVEWLAEHLAQATAVDGEYPRAVVEARETGAAARLRGITSVIPREDSREPYLGVIEPVTAHTPKNPQIFPPRQEL
jgi:hypothetical protein